MINVEQTVISQYSNSATIVKLVQNMNEYIDPRADVDNFYFFVWDVETAQGFGLDILGRIVDIPRVWPQNVTLSDEEYRTLILFKALVNISVATVPSINVLLRNLLGSYGRCYVNDLGNMMLRYAFEFVLTPFQQTLVTQSGAMLRPAGVAATILSTTLPCFGFSEAGTYSAAPFGQAPFVSEDATHEIS